MFGATTSLVPERVVPFVGELIATKWEVLSPEPASESFEIPPLALAHLASRSEKPTKAIRSARRLPHREKISPRMQLQNPSKRHLVHRFSVAGPRRSQ